MIASQINLDKIFLSGLFSAFLQEIVKPFLMVNLTGTRACDLYQWEQNIAHVIFLYRISIHQVTAWEHALTDNVI